MLRWSLLSAAALAAAGVAGAQPSPEPKDGKVTYRVTVSPAAVPVMPSDYYVFPEYRDLQPGEKLGGFLKCFMEQTIFYNNENTDKRQKWLEMPLAELPADVREQAGIKGGIAYDPKYATMMVFMDQAARYTRVEWNEWFNLRHDGANLLLPEVQKLRALAQVLKLRMRGEVKNGEFGRATVTAKTLFGLGQMLERHPCLIGNLVGIAIEMIALSALEEMIQQPGCPNLYWSFADLPMPVMDLRTGLGGEKVFLTAQFEPVLKANRALSDKEVTEQVDTIAQMFSFWGPGGPDEQQKRKADVVKQYKALAADRPRMDAERTRLVGGGASADLVRTFSPLQLALTADLRRYELARDQQFKWVNLPYPLAKAGLKQVDEDVQKSKADAILAPVLLPALLKVKSAQVRLDQVVGCLRVIEAVRLYAHEHEGMLPESLDAVSVPLPPDPVSGKPFQYSVKDGVATLTGSQLENPTPQPARVYEIRVRK